MSVPDAGTRSATRALTHQRSAAVLITAAAAFFSTCGIFGIINHCLIRNNSNELRTEAMRSAIAHLHPVQESPIGTDATNSGKLSPATIEIALEKRRSLRRMFLDGQDQWLETLVQLDDPAFTAAKRLECASEFGTSISTCLYRISMVIQPDDNASGTIVHATADLIAPEDSPGLANHNDPGCPAYISCIADSRIGETIPIPTDERSAFALEQLYQSNQAHPALFDAGKVRQSIEAFESELSRLRSNSNRSMQDEWQLRKLENLVRYLEHHLAELEEIESNVQD